MGAALSDLDDKARLIQEAVAQLTWETDAAALVEKVKRLDIGLPVEDEFLAVCSWLGKCSLIHKLDQQQLPEKSRDKYQVPDILALFSTQSTPTPLLIEVKSSKKPALSFTGSYYAKLDNYSKLVGMPVLIAWKLHSLWMLFEIKHMKKAKSNYNIKLSDAIQQTLMGVLAGDFAYKIGPGAGIRVRLKKEALISSEDTLDGRSDQWQMRVDDVSFTDRLNTRHAHLSADVQSLFMTWDLQESETETDTHIHLDMVAGEEGIEFAHRALSSFLQWEEQSERPQWRQALRKSHINDNIKRFRHAVDEGLRQKVVSLVLDVNPHTMPAFLPPEVEPLPRD